MAVDIPERPCASTGIALLVEGALQLRVLSSLSPTDTAYFQAPLLLEHQHHSFCQIHLWQNTGALDEGGYILLRCYVFVFPFAHETLWAMLLGVALLATSFALAAFSACLGADFDGVVEGVAPITAGAAL